MAVGRRQHPLDRRDHHERRAESERLPERHATDGRCTTHADRRLGARRLYLVAQPRERPLRRPGEGRLLFASTNIRTSRKANRMQIREDAAALRFPPWTLAAWECPTS